MQMNDAQNKTKNWNNTSGDTARPIFLDVGILDVPKADELISELGNLRREDRVPDLLLFLGYTPCLAVGARLIDSNDFLKPLEYFTQLGVPLYKSARGGGLTFHWPGQLVCYPILKLMPEEQNIPKYMFMLEEIALRTLASFDVQANRKRDKTAQIGLWVGDDKIASMGIRISQWVTSYGFALNLDGDSSPSHHIRPCGLDANLVTVEQQTGIRPARSTAQEKVLFHFSDILGRSFSSLFQTSKQENEELWRVLEKYGINHIGR
jgi:lipoate-protein ligase B